MDIRIFPLGPIETNAFLVVAGSEALLVDAPWGAHETILPILENEDLALQGLLLTHGHWDHTTDAYRFQKDGVALYGHEDDRTLFEDPSAMEPFSIPRVPMEPVRIDRWVSGGEELDLIGERIEVRHVPGHCPGNVLFYFPDHGACISGDALFAGGIGRYDLPGGDFSVLEKSIRERIYTLPDETEVYPGHGPVTTVRSEKSRNPYVRG